jgi:hypothetical protein
MWDVNKAVKCLDEHANLHSMGRCAEYTRKAIEAGGVILKRVLNRFGEVGSIDVRSGNHVTRFNPGADKTKYIHNVL